MTKTDSQHYRSLLGRRFAGRKVILTGMVAGAPSTLELMRDIGAERPLMLAEGIGTGELPSEDELEWILVGKSKADNVMQGIRAYEARLANLAAHMLGIVEKPEEAIRWNERAIGMAEAAESERSRGWLGPLYNNLAWTYNDLGRHEDALALFEKDVTFRESLGRSFEASIALWSKAKTLRLLGRVPEALEIQESLVDHPDRKGKPAEGYTHEEIGECLLLLGRGAKAAPHFAIAFARLGVDPWLKANESERLDRIERLSRAP